MKKHNCKAFYGPFKKRVLTLMKIHYMMVIVPFTISSQTFVHMNLVCLVYGTSPCWPGPNPSTPPNIHSCLGLPETKVVKASWIEHRICKFRHIFVAAPLACISVEKSTQQQQHPGKCQLVAFFNKGKFRTSSPCWVQTSDLNTTTKV